MPAKCQVCGEEDFECERGMYYCTTCSTQTQDYIDEDTEMISYTGGIDGRRIIKPKIAKQKTIEEEKEDERPWVRSEGLTIILREQVKALIALGASPNLKDVVLRLWTFYLRETGLGFGGEDKVDATKTYGDNSRFIHVPTYDKVKPVCVATKLKLVKTRRGKANIAVEDQQALRLACGGEDFYDEDNPLTIRATEPTELDMRMEIEEVRQEERKTKRLTKMAHTHQMVSQGQRMMLPMTLAFCYIGLQFNNGLIILNDVIKLVMSGRLPYNNGVLLFPSNMKLTGADWKFFSVHRRPGVEHLRYNTARLCKVLDLFPLPKPDFSHLILRFLLDLNLPANLHTIIRALLQLDEPNYGKALTNTVPAHELLAMAYVVIATKMVFCLNDDIEGELSTFSEAVADVIGPDTGIRLFKWTDWLKDQALREIGKTKIHEDWRGVRTSTHTEPYCKAFDMSCSLKSTNPNSRYNEETARKNMTTIFQQMCSKVDNITISPNPEPTNKDPRQSSDQNTDNYMLDDMLPPVSGTVAIEEISADVGRSQEETATNQATFSDYTQHSILHILDLEYFIEQAMPCSPRSDCVKISLRELSSNYIKAWENYIFYPFVELENCHKSYGHLVEVAASHIGYTASRLHFFVQNVELIYFNEKKKLFRVMKHLKSKEKTFRNFYFSK